MHRRKLLIGLGLSPLVAPSLLHAGQDGDKGESAAELLFVQNAQGVSLANGTLHLKDVGASTLFFSDRPQRIAGHVPSKVFVGHWSAGGDDSFENDPPNATLSILESKTPQEIVVELRNPRWKGRDLIYDVTVLDGAESAEGGACSLFIDDTVIVNTGPAVVGGPMSYRGQARRVARRTARRTARRWH